MSRQLVKLPTDRLSNDSNTRHKRANHDLTVANNRLKGIGRVTQGESKGADYDEHKDPVIYEEIMQEPELELLSISYMDTILGRKAKGISLDVKKRVVEEVNGILKQMHISEGDYYRHLFASSVDSFLGSNSKVTLEQYAKACLFVTYRACGDTKIKAYAKTFPNRIKAMEAKGQNLAYLDRYANAYSKTKAVIDVQAKTLIPAHILLYELHYQAFKVAADIMVDNKVSAKVRLDAANVIITHTKAPETKQHSIDLNIKETGAITELKDALNKIAQVQHTQIHEGVCDIEDVIAQKIYTEEDESEY